MPLPHNPSDHQVERRQAVRRHAQRRHHRFYAARLDGNFIQNFAAAPISWTRERWVIGALAGLLSLLVVVVIPSWASSNPSPAGDQLSWSALALPAAPPPDASAQVEDRRIAFVEGNYIPIAETGQWTSLTVESGQTLGQLFAADGIPASQMVDILGKMAKASTLTQLSPGEHLGLRKNAAGRLTAIQFDAGAQGRIQVDVSDSGEVTERELAGVVEKRIRVASGVIEGSLFGAGDAAGLSDATILQMAKVFSYDIDFAQDLREGDRFSVVYEDHYRNGEPVSGGDILAATFVNRGKRFEALRFQVPGADPEYYDGTGRPLRKAFIRTPVEFTRISSRFSSARRHPILGTVRAHRGVDYAAPAGTPIIAAADGNIVSAGWQNGYGNTVVIDHGKGHTTLYGHMSRYSAASKRGNRVRQGTVIGYVGKTGLATAPHLHYEFRIAGVHRDPLKLTLPPPPPLPAGQLATFKLKTAALSSQLASAESRLDPVTVSR
jgi:murein DD-endopeptidase MepM/ murein hydrolase activator NlpD